MGIARLRGARRITWYISQHPFDNVIGYTPEHVVVRPPEMSADLTDSAVGRFYARSSRLAPGFSISGAVILG